jgi:hypothetical protein
MVITPGRGGLKLDNRRRCAGRLSSSANKSTSIISGESRRRSGIIEGGNSTAAIVCVVVVVAVKGENNNRLQTADQAAHGPHTKLSQIRPTIKFLFSFLQSLLHSVFSASYCKSAFVLCCCIQRMTLFSSPSYTTMPRKRACLFATDARSTERTVYLPVPFCLILIASLVNR